MGQTKLLVVDRDEDVGQSIREFFKEDCEVLYLNDGSQILKTIAEQNVDVLLTDIDIPNVYFYHILNRVREEFPNLHILIMYVYCDQTQEMENTIRKMASAVFLKPFDLEALRHTIFALCQNGSAPEKPGEGREKEKVKS